MNKSKTITLKDVSQHVGVDVSTVSKIINNRGERYSKVTKEKIFRAVKELGFHPNFMAKGLRINKTTLLGAIVPALHVSFFGHIAQGMEDEAEKSGHSIILHTSHYKTELEAKYIEIFQRKRVEGILLFPSPANDNLHLITSLVQIQKIPVLFLGFDLKIEGVPSITVDNVKGAYIAVEHLVHLGHRRIAHLAGEKGLLIANMRLEGYWKAIKELVADSDDRLVIHTDNTVKSAYEATKLLFSINPRPTAIFAYSDHLAIGAKLAISEIGLKIPHDVALVGFDDMEFCEMIDIPLTTISQPKREMGIMAVKKLRNLIEGIPQQSEVIMPTLVIRQSCGANKQVF